MGSVWKAGAAVSFVSGRGDMHAFCVFSALLGVPERSIIRVQVFRCGCGGANGGEELESQVLCIPGFVNIRNLETVAKNILLRPHCSFFFSVPSAYIFEERLTLPATYVNKTTQHNDKQY